MHLHDIVLLIEDRTPGWRCATSKYLAEIQRMIEDFHTDMPSVLAVNRPSINAYLTITPVWTLLAGMERYDESAHHHRFQQYIDSEEARIKANLEKFNYRIDARDTLKLVIGSARIERVRYCGRDRIVSC